jgi:plastocyanin
MTVFKCLVWCVFVVLANLTLCGAATTNTVTVGNFFFNPRNLVIAPGDSVRWTNASINVHDTTHNPPAGAPLWEQDLSISGGGRVYRFTFTNAGYYPYICEQHIVQQQTGAVLVASTHHKALELLPDGRMQFLISGGRQGYRAVTEGSVDLGTWRGLGTNTFPSGGSITFIDAGAPTNGLRYYRSRVIPPP